MDTVRFTLQMIRKRPGAMIIFSILLLIYSIAGYYNPIPAILVGLSSITKGNLFESIVSYLQIIMDSKIVPVFIIAVLAVTVIASLILALFLSGYFYSVDNTITGKKKTRGEYTEGLKMYFSRILLISLRVIIFGFLFVVFMLVATIPAAVVTRAALSGNQEIAFAAVFIDILTACVLFFGCMFFRAYMFFWYPAAISREKGFFVAGKRVADLCFWNILKTFLLFDVILIAFEYALLKIGNNPGTLVAGWIFRTIFYVLFINYIFVTYRKAERLALKNNNKTRQS